MRIAIVGYGDMGREVENCASLFDDISVFAIFTQRKAQSIIGNMHTVLPFESLKNFRNEIDVVVNCRSSETDLTEMLAENFNVIDCFGEREKFPEHLKRVDEICKKSATTAIVCCGFDPGLVSLHRMMMKVCFQGKNDKINVVSTNLPDYKNAARILLCYARALQRMSRRREMGCFTVFDVKPIDLAFMTAEEMYEVI